MLTQIELSVLLFSEGGSWLAQSLEHDLCAQGKSAKDALDGLVACCFSHMKNALRRTPTPDHPLKDVPPAPELIRALSDDAWKIVPPPMPLYFIPQEIVDVWPIALKFQLYLVVE